MNVVKPIVEVLPDNKVSLKRFQDDLYTNLGDKNADLIENYPTVYIHHWEVNGKYVVYVGESNNFFERTKQHYEAMKNSDSWQYNIQKHKSFLIVIAHEYFNKSLTLDIENGLIHYLSSSSSVDHVYNEKSNPQRKYYSCEKFNDIFETVWRKLRHYNKDLFLSESEIKDSAIYKASPLHKLNDEQMVAKDKVLLRIAECLISNNDHQLIFIHGNAGTGKTVLLSSIFYELLNRKKFSVENNGDRIINDIECGIIVNHEEQLTVYEEIIYKLSLAKNKEHLVFNPTQFINLFKDRKNSPKKRDKLFDVVFVDEAHLLWTQNNQAFLDNNQLDEIMKYAKVVVAVFDENQIMNAEQYLPDSKIKNYIKIAEKSGNYIELKHQMRMNASEDVLSWLNLFVNKGNIVPLSKRKCGSYEMKLFNTPEDLEKAIKEKAKNPKTSLSRLVATYDWLYKKGYSPKNEKYWSVKIGSWSKPWNRELIRCSTSKDKRKVKGLSWAEQPQTIDEVGSIYTVQGFDLNYVGVIIGPSVKYRNGKVVFDVNESKNEKAKRKRTLEDGSKECFAEDFIRHELGVLLTRGVNGLYIYAVDQELREQLNVCLKN